jgi:copper oxidase (laccase) domain-containing protein
MNERFGIVSCHDLSLLVYLPWWEEGIVHGMTLRDPSFRSHVVDKAMPRFHRSCGTSELVTPKQTHSDHYLDARVPGELSRLRERYPSLLFCEEGDAVISSVHQYSSERRLAVGITTADCVPIVVRSTQGWAVIHAGWRGLANGIISKVVLALGSPQEAVVLASAGGDRYEVGREVVDAIGSTAVCHTSGGGVILLDTAETARAQLTRYLAYEAIHCSGVCTISDARFHSFRRDGESAGRSLTFVVPPPR